MVKVGKPKSKRVPVRLRHKIEKSSAAKQRKLRKEGKKNPQWVSRLKKDPGIPNLFPFKDKILAEVEESRRNKEEEKERRRLVAKAQREGRTLADVQKEQGGVGAQDGEDEEDEDEDLIDPTEDDDVNDLAMADVDESNPMAALLASAEARANSHQHTTTSADNAPDEGAATAATILSTKSRNNKTAKPTPSTSTATAPSQRTPLPQKALEDPIPTLTTLLTHLSATPSKFAPLTSYYALPALPESLSLTDFQTRFLVEVARKRGRLGKGGIPNLHASALTVLADVQEGRVKLPPLTSTTAATAKTGKKGKGKREVAKQEEGATRILVGEEMAKPFRIEGLFGETYGGGKEAEEKMEE